MLFVIATYAAAKDCSSYLKEEYEDDALLHMQTD